MLVLQHAFLELGEAPGERRFTTPTATMMERERRTTVSHARHAVMPPAWNITTRRNPGKLPT
jgi:hypothetical protein